MAHIFQTEPIPAKAGIGLRWPHYDEVIKTTPDIAWFEVHPENFFADGGITLEILGEIRKNYPLSLHGVGLSLGSAEKPGITHLKRLKTLIDRFNPALVSEHISWSMVDGIFLNDLLPVPYTVEAMAILIENISYTQDYLGRRILVENPSTYLEFAHSEMPEHEFIREVCKKSGCGMLLDINNIYVSSINHNLNAEEYIAAIPPEIVGEIHVAGYAECDIDGMTLLIDNHGDYVSQPVWELYSNAIGKFGPTPTLIEWDKDIPALSVLMGEAEKAEGIMYALSKLMA